MGQRHDNLHLHGQPPAEQVQPAAAERLRMGTDLRL